MTRSSLSCKYFVKYIGTVCSLTMLREITRLISLRRKITIYFDINFWKKTHLLIKQSESCNSSSAFLRDGVWSHFANCSGTQEGLIIDRTSLMLCYSHLRNWGVSLCFLLSKLRFEESVGNLYLIKI